MTFREDHALRSRLPWIDWKKTQRSSRVRAFTATKLELVNNAVFFFLVLKLIIGLQLSAKIAPKNMSAPLQRTKRSSCVTIFTSRITISLEMDNLCHIIRQANLTATKMSVCDVINFKNLTYYDKSKDTLRITHSGAHLERNYFIYFL